MNTDKIITQNIEVTRPKLSEKVNQKMVAENNLFQGLLFVGNKHETVPLRLLTDKYLTPRAKTAWQLIKINAYQFQGTVFPTYDKLALWLSDRVFQGKPISRKIVSQTLLILRLTRWLTLCETVRNETGQILGNVYIMNDEPLTVSDCIQLNDDYLRLLEKSAKHKDPLVKDIAISIIDEILTDKSILWHAVSHINIICERYKQLNTDFDIQPKIIGLPENLNQAIEGTKQNLLNSSLSSNMELCKNERELSQKIDNEPSSNMELRYKNDDKSLILGSVPYWNSGTKYSTNTNLSTKYSTDNNNKLLSGLDIKLTQLEKKQVAIEMQDLDEETQKAVLFEIQERVANGSVRKPLGYLLGLIRRAKSGDFNPYMLNKNSQPIQKAHDNTRIKQNILSSRDNDKTKAENRVSQKRQLEMLSQFTQMIRGA
ncbi:STY4528 family pathogenicity island replication protein [Pasteurella skyensis]|uniref:STY4528 family pathogenicity island replication protein n=1 Tax=Phocoenobacter skyensis TaxID=97481 RepID=UPI002765C761|nr:STY4528 family pathogenicity island replication protein [Pasteurella skyensis]MDP8189096.1 STY4528 family pathogenicity island replication protein [Pasteurella skyensis]